MKILQTILEDRTLYVFTDNPDSDIILFHDRYETWESKIHLWYEEPRLYNYKFLWKLYPCIALWYDNEEDMAIWSKEMFNNLINK